MAYVVVENFSAGLDTRRHPLTAKPGTLQTLKNAHISRGGEIEKRKKFASFANLPANTFGMEATPDTIYVFGSTDGVTTPAGVTYQRCVHPDGSPMTAVVYTTLYGGKPFVIAKFADGSTYPFLDGVIIADFVNGISRASMNNIVGFSSHLASCIGDGFTATASGNIIIVSGPDKSAYTLNATAESPFTAAVSKLSNYTAPIPEVLGSGSFAVTGGTVGVSATTKRELLANPDGLTMGVPPNITGIYVNGIEITGVTGSGFNYTSPPPEPLYNYPNVNHRLAWAITYYINQNTGNNGGFTALYERILITLKYRARTTISAPKTPYNGVDVWLEFASNPSSTVNIADLIDTSSITTSPYNATRFIAKFGTFSNGVFNGINSVTIDGVEVLGSPVAWSTSNTATMTAIANQINAFTSSTEYVASMSSAKVNLTGVVGSGASVNGKVISVTAAGTATVGSFVNMAGGVNFIPAVKETYSITIGGTFTPGKSVTISAALSTDPNNPYYWGATRVANSSPVSAITFKTKAHITSNSTLFFSGVNQPQEWGLHGVGSGFINLSNNNGGNEVLTGLALYQGNLAAFARRSVQIWGIDTDPVNNRQGQVLSNTGAISANSIVSVGEIDVFYLSDSGVRSLRARDASNAAVVNDVGTPVDNLVLADLNALTDTQKSLCSSIIEPIDGRYWLAIGSKIYVYSYFPNSQVAAWSTYEPGFSVSKFATKDGRVYARAGDAIYLYGGTSGSEYDSSTVEVIMPYLDGGKPAHTKNLNGIDMTCEGFWQVYVGMDPSAVSARDLIATVNQSTFSLGRIMAVGIGTHIGLRLVNNSDGYARLANLIAHFDLNEAN